MNYELTIILPGKVTPAKRKTFIGNIEKLIKVFKGKVIKTDDWGVRELAYPIKKNQSGTYLLFEVELDEASAKELPKKLNLEEEIIRYLLVKKQ